MSASAPSRMSWHDICAQKQYRGRWVALDGCRYETGTQQPSEGTVVDVDDDLAELCNRMKRANQRCCAILFCEAAQRFRAGTRH